MTLYLAGNQVSGNDTSSLSINKHGIEHIATIEKGDIACGNLTA